MLGPDVGGVVVSGDVVRRNLPLGDQLADVELAESNVLGARAERSVPERMQSCSVVAVKWHLNELLPKPKPRRHVHAEHGFFHRECRCNQLSLHSGHGSQALKARLEANWCSGQHHDVARRRLAVVRVVNPVKLASEKAVSLNPPFLYTMVKLVDPARYLRVCLAAIKTQPGVLPKHATPISWCGFLHARTT